MSVLVGLDGANVLNMGIAMHLPQSRINYSALFEILMELVGDDKLEGQPVITLPDVTHIEKRLRTDSYEVVPATSWDGQDDKALIGYISSCPPEVNRIILVSADADFIPALDEKVRQGVAVTIVATYAPRTDGEVMIGPGLDHRIKTGRFGFVELADYRDRLIEVKPTPRFPGTRLIIESRNEGAMPNVISELAEDLSRLKEKYGIDFKVETT